MDSVAQFLIDILTAFKTLDPATKVAWVVGVLGAAAAPFVALRRWIKSQETRYVARAAEAERDLAAAERTVKELSSELRGLREHDSSTVLARLDAEERDGNRISVIRIADRYLEHHRAAFARTCGVLSKHHLTRFEDGFSALDRARTAAMGAVAADPKNRDYRLLLEEIEALIRIEESPPENREAHKAQEELARLRRRLEESDGDIKALMEIGRKQIEIGLYSNAIAFFERAKAEFFISSDISNRFDIELWIEAKLASAHYFAGNLNIARTHSSEIAERAKNTLGSEHAVTLGSTVTFARAALDLGFDKEAKPVIIDLL